MLDVCNVIYMQVCIGKCIWDISLHKHNRIHCPGYKNNLYQLDTTDQENSLLNDFVVDTNREKINTRTKLT